MTSKLSEGAYWASIIAGLRSQWPDFELTNNDQKNPSSETVVRFYNRFICGQLQITIDDMKNVLIENSSYPDQFGGILNELALYLSTQTVIKKLGLDELIQVFGLTDLLNPSRMTFKKPLVLLSSCVLYAANLQELMEQIRVPIIEGLKNIDKMQEKIDEVTEKINITALVRTKNLDKTEELQNELKILKKEVETLQQIEESHQEERKTAQQELNAMQDKYENYEKELKDVLLLEQQFKERNNAREIRKRLEAEVAELKRESEEHDRIMEKKMQTITFYHNNNKIINEYIENTSIDKIVEKYELIKEYKNAIEKLTKELLNCTETRDQFIKEKNDKETEYDLWMDKTKEFISKSENIKTNFDNEIQQLKSEYEKDQDKLKATKKVYENLKSKTKNITKKNQGLEENIEKQNRIYKQQYKQILDLKAALENKIINLFNIIEKPNGEN